MNESDQNLEGRQEEKRENSYTDPYVSESSPDSYTAPEVVVASPVSEENSVPAAVVDTHGLFSGNQQQNTGMYQAGPSGSNYGSQLPYGNQAGGGYGSQISGGYGGQFPYGDQAGGRGQAPYNGQSSYGSQAGGGVQTSYNDQNPYDAPTFYGNQAGGYGGQMPYNGQAGGQPPYGNQPGYGGQTAYNGQNPYGNQPYYGSQAGGGYGGQPPFGGQPPYINPYNPYAVPQKKQHTGLIVGIVIVILLLFLAAVFALASKAVHMLSEKEKEEIRQDVYDFEDDYNDNHHDAYDYDYDLDDGYGYDGYYDYDYDYSEEEYDDRYYTLQQDLKYDLFYEMNIEEYEYETDYDNVLITAAIPVISGDDVPNLDKLNEGIRKEVDRITELFEKDYEAHVKEDKESYFGATMAGYVTYMDEDKLSVVYQEEIYSDLGGGVYLICINIDMKSGVILDNEEMLEANDDFSIDFRQRSDEQNGEIEYLYYMTDQQITDYFNSDNIIVFYTPMGMEIGFNYEEGWVTATYEDYEKYLKVF